MAGLFLATAALAMLAYAGLPWRPVASSTFIVSTAAELQEAISSASDGSRIEIGASNTLTVNPIEVVGKSITIAAAEGYQPKIRLSREHDTTPDFLVRVSRGSLSLLDLHLFDDLDAEEQIRLLNEDVDRAGEYGLVTVVDAAFSAQRCRLQTRSNGCCLELTSSKSAVLQDCKLLAREGTGIDWTANDGEQLVLDRSVLVGVVAILMDLEGNATLDWKHSTSLTALAAIEFTAVNGELSACVSDCVIQSADALILSPLSPSSLNRFKRTLDWRGSGNQVQGHAVRLDDRVRAPGWTEQVSAWAVVDKDSTYDRKLFGAPLETVLEAVLQGRSARSMLLTATSD